MAERAAAVAFWAERLGCAPSSLLRPGLTLVPHPEPAAVYAVAVGEAVVVAAPESLGAALRSILQPTALVTPEALRPLVPEARLVGPARIAYLYRPVAEPDGVERIDSPRDSRLAALRERVTAEEWQHANLDAAEPPIFACSTAGEVAAASGFQRLAGRVAHIGVLCDPSQRSKGLGRRVVQAAAARALELGLLTQYQTLASNTPALRIAESLGFEPFAITLSARFSAAL